MPASALLFVEMLSVFYEGDSVRMRAGAARLSVAFLCVALASLVGNLASCAAFTVVGEKLTRRLREAAFGRMLRQHAAWCDQPGHTAAALGYVLGADAAVVRPEHTRLIRVRVRWVS